MTTWNPTDYRRNSTQQELWARQIIAKLVLNNSEHVLDLGCGDGKVTAEIARQVPNGQVLGIDNSAVMIEFARSTFPASDWPNLRFDVMDARELRFVEQFDLVFSNAVLHWIKDHRPVLRGIAAALRPEGKMLVQMGGSGNAAEVLAVLEELRQEPPWRAYLDGFGMPYGFHRPEDYRRWLAEAGLQAQRVELIPKDMVHAGAEGLEGWIRTTWMPYTQRVPGSLREQFVSELAETYLRRYPLDAAGRAHVAMIRLEVEAAKPSAAGKAPDR